MCVTKTNARRLTHEWCHEIDKPDTLDDSSVLLHENTKDHTSGNTDKITLEVYAQIYKCLAHLTHASKQYIPFKMHDPSLTRCLLFQMRWMTSASNNLQDCLSYLQKPSAPSFLLGFVLCHLRDLQAAIIGELEWHSSTPKHHQTIFMSLHEDFHVLAQDLFILHLHDACAKADPSPMLLAWCKSAQSEKLGSWFHCHLQCAEFSACFVFGWW